MRMSIWLVGQSHFGLLHTAGPSSEQFHLTGLQMVAADLPIGETPLSLAEVREPARKLKGGKRAGVCNINGELPKAGGETMARRLYAVPSAVWQSCANPLKWKKMVGCPIWKGTSTTATV